MKTTTVRMEMVPTKTGVQVGIRLEAAAFISEEEIAVSMETSGVTRNDAIYQLALGRPVKNNDVDGMVIITSEIMSKSPVYEDKPKRVVVG